MPDKFEHKKSLGQHFLNSDYAPKKMCDAADIQVGDIVLEIGPGTGALTKELLSRGSTVIAVEADNRAIAELEVVFPEYIKEDKLIIHHKDARSLDLTSLDLVAGQYKVVSNIPYYLSGMLFRSLLDTDCQPMTLVFLVQKEVAERIARTEKESLLSLSVKVFGNPTYICTVKRGHFTPPPKVDSAVVAINNINKESFVGISEELFFQVIHLGFAQKRKQLLGNLSKTFCRTALEAVFTSLSLPHTVRAEDIPLEIWLILVKKLSALEISTDNLQ
ncbi:MAG: 16S rRNA (adenine(1518)-N(6)/adenine(1519)-N(6))-dimethyltransferase RsmA [Candidatus Pacebacteria bacterium]|nr:16S rRNA (adenine(1518)-N(6)/adenine(1519)-N(6))-dimethyltransferase RsmA [Candidatus Paceibacterota bacterium]